jgi:hypothetical protein
VLPGDEAFWWANLRRGAIAFFVAKFSEKFAWSELAAIDRRVKLAKNDRGFDTSIVPVRGGGLFPTREPTKTGATP